MSQQSEAMEVARLLRKLAKWVEEHPKFFEDRYERTAKISFDPFRLLAEEGEKALEAKLVGLSATQLQALIKNYRLDTSGQTRKWRDKVKLRQFVNERLRDKWAHGSAFEDRSTQVSQ